MVYRRKSHQVVDGCLGFSFAVHFARIGPASTAPPAAGRRMAQIGPGLKAALAGVRTRIAMKGTAATSAVLLTSIARHPDSTSSGSSTFAVTERRVFRPPWFWAKRKSQVVPHTGEGNC